MQFSKDERRYIEGFWLVAEDHANWIGPARTADVGSGPMLSGALDEARAIALSARFEPEWRNKSYQPIPHDPDRRAEVWFADDETDRSAA
jgi:hypothetical protein